MSNKRKSAEPKVDKMAKSVAKAVVREVKKPKSTMRSGTAALARTGGNFAQLGASSGHEKKVIDTALTAAFTSAGAMTLCNGCQTGSDYTNRVGRRIKMKSILLRLGVQVGSTPTTDIYRLMLVYDAQTNGAAPSVTDVLNSGTARSTNNLSNRARFRTLLDWTDTMDTAGPTVRFKVVFIRKDLVTTFNAGNAGTVADIQTGSLYILQVGGQAAGVTATTLSGQCRVRFEDD